MKKGKKKILEDVDVPHLRSADGSRTCFDLFNEQVEMLKRKDPLGRPSILMAILLCHHKSILITGVFALIKILTMTTGPLFLHTFIEVAEGKESFKCEGYAPTAGFSADYVMGALSGKTVLLVTHQVEFLPAFDSILLISSGKIMKSGTFDELLSKSEEFQDLVNAQKTTFVPKCQVVYASKRPKAAEIELDNNVSSEERDDVGSLKGDQLIKAEEREVGDAGFKPYIQ
ncbi:hypothetical protein KY284_008160 [Solanum tuberosum]|nr:hypothetical protein KY284_008160 [Solanum tuberosum]